jgi:hypothetical protein
MQDRDVGRPCLRSGPVETAPGLKGAGRVQTRVAQVYDERVQIVSQAFRRGGVAGARAERERDDRDPRCGAAARAVSLDPYPTISAEDPTSRAAGSSSREATSSLR